MRAFVSYFMRGRRQAIMVALVSAALSLAVAPLIFLTGAVIGLVTLRNGAREGLVVWGISSLAIVMFAQLALAAPIGIFPVLLWLAVWGLGLTLRNTMSLPVAITLAGFLGAAVVVVAYVVLGDPAAWWQSHLDALLTQLQEAQTPAPPHAAVEQWREALADAAPRMTGASAAVLMLGACASLLLARGWQAMLYNPGGFRREFRALRLGTRFASATTAVLLVAVLASGLLGEAAENLMTVLVATYVLAGFGLLHCVVDARGWRPAWLGAAYILGMFLPLIPVLIAVAGYVDSWADLRRRYIPGSNNQSPGGP